MLNQFDTPGLAFLGAVDWLKEHGEKVVVCQLAYLPAGGMSNLPGGMSTH